MDETVADIAQCAARRLAIEMDPDLAAIVEPETRLAIRQRQLSKERDQQFGVDLGTIVDIGNLIVAVAGLAVSIYPHLVEKIYPHLVEKLITTLKHNVPEDCTDLQRDRVIIIIAEETVRIIYQRRS